MWKMMECVAVILRELSPDLLFTLGEEDMLNQGTISYLEIIRSTEIGGNFPAAYQISNDSPTRDAPAISL
jgi:hypothetical protein